MIKFYNVRTGEERTVDTEPLIAAFFNSSNLGPNSNKGQDFGWRLAPETIARIREIRRDPVLMPQIAAQFQLALDEVGDTDIVRWISIEAARAEAAKLEGDESDYTQQYEDEIRAIERGNRVENDPNPSQPAGAPKEQPRQQERTVEDVKRENQDQAQPGPSSDNTSGDTTGDADSVKTNSQTSTEETAPSKPEKASGSRKSDSAK